MKSWTDDIKSSAVNLAKDVVRASPYERVMSALPWTSQAAGLTLLRAHGDLKDRGWFHSFVRRLPVDAKGRPLPWFTYGSIAFLTPRIQSSWRVFEYGSGHSTLWWSERVKEVVAVEHHQQWADKISKQLPDNATLMYRALAQGTSYPDAPVEAGGKFDVIVIDGRERIWCAERCFSALAANGVIIWDNSERPRYQPGLKRLAELGFRHVDFDGMGPINTYGWRTTLLYRDDNVLGL
ncbi:MAG: FkbM family methyltransferase [Myxococcales bacterium]|nr:FkbM family methyltransferase [Myxococcales bacterium]